MLLVGCCSLSVVFNPCPCHSCCSCCFKCLEAGPLQPHCLQGRMGAFEHFITTDGYFLRVGSLLIWSLPRHWPRATWTCQCSSFSGPVFNTMARKPQQTQKQQHGRVQARGVGVYCSGLGCRGGLSVDMRASMRA